MYERLLPLIANQLNNIHGKNYEIKYWRILIGPWLSAFIQILFDRWECIQQAINFYDIKETTSLNYNDQELVPNSTDDFNHYFTTDEWNHYIFSKIILFSTNIIINKKEDKSQLFLNKSDIKKPLMKIVAEKLSNVLSYLGKDDDIFFISTYLPLIKQIKLELKLGQLPQYRIRYNLPYIEYDQNKRNWLFMADNNSDFESFLFKMIPKQIPLVYLEGYNLLNDKKDKHRWPKSPKIIWTSNSDNSDENFKIYAAEKINEGAKLVIGQHGGHYGLGQWSSSEDHHLAISDYYMSWGWNDSLKLKIKPIGYLKAKSGLNKKYHSNKNLLMVCNSIPRYSYRMYSSIVSSQYLNYLDDQFNFVDNLSSRIRNKLIVRLYKDDYGWKQKERWNYKFSNLNIDSGLSKLDDLIKNTRIFISTYNATTYLESLYLNIPTVIFWDSRYWELRESAKPYFEALKDVGIFHDTPESAATHINKIWNKVDIWWESKDVIKARKLVCNQYAHKPKDLVNKIENTFKDIIN